MRMRSEQELKDQIDQLPKGNLCFKMTGGKRRCYHQWTVRPVRSSVRFVTDIKTGEALLNWARQASGSRMAYAIET